MPRSRPEAAASWLDGPAPLFGWRGAALALPLAALLCWPAWTTGTVLVFADTASYLRAGDAIWSTIVDAVRSILPAASPGGMGGGSVLEVDRQGGGTVGRSVTYGFAAHVLNAAMGPLALAVAQTWFTLVAAFALVTGDALRRPWILAGGLAALALLTPLPFFATYLMPDLLAAVPILFAAALVWRFDALAPVQRVALTGMTALAVSAHYGAIPLALAAGAAALVLRLPAGRGLGLGPAVAVAATVAFAPLLNVGASSVALERTSVAPLRLPILLARSIEDGPARWYLEERCPEAPLVLCEIFADGVPRNVGAVLWSPDGVGDATREQMVQVRQEEWAVLARAFAAYPVAQSWSLLRNGARQAVLVGTRDLRPAAGIGPDLEPAYVGEDHRARALLRGMDPVVGWGTLAVAALALAFAARSRPDRAAIWAVLAVVAGLLANAGIFGGLSAPVDRYQSRVIWVLPMVLVLVWADAAARRDRRAAARRPPAGLRAA